MELNLLFMRKLLAPVLVSLLLLGTAIAPSAFALQSDKQQSQDISKSQAAEKARAQVKGRVLKVEKRKNDYRVKVLQKSGRVVTVDVDGRSGRVTKKQSDREH